MRRLALLLLGAALCCFFMYMGGVAVAEGWDRRGNVSELSEHGRSATGVVVSAKDVQKGPAGTVRTTKISFTTPGGTRHTLQGRGDEAVGSKVRVLYDPADPNVAVPAGSEGLRTFQSIAIICIGLALILFPPSFLLKLAWESRQRVTPP